MRNAILLLAAFFCAACSNYSANLPSIKPYKMDIQQGNVVTSKMMMQLRPGMTKTQVRFIMGTPLIVDSFHKDRWDYIYRMEKGGKLLEQRHVILEFENEQLKRVRGDVIPAGSDAIAESAKPAEPKPAAPAEPPKKEKGLIDKLKFWKGGEEKAPAKLESQPELVKPAPAKVAPAQRAADEQPGVEPKPAPQPQPEQAPARKAPEPEEPSAAPAPEEPARPAAEPEPVRPSPAPARERAAPAAEPQPAQREQAPAPAAAESRPQAEPVPADDLPPEDDPGYFERMLEKIGF